MKKFVPIDPEGCSPEDRIPIDSYPNFLGYESDIVFTGIDILDRLVDIDLVSICEECDRSGSKLTTLSAGEAEFPVKIASDTFSLSFVLNQLPSVEVQQDHDLGAYIWFLKDSSSEEELAEQASELNAWMRSLIESTELVEGKDFFYCPTPIARWRSYLCCGFKKGEISGLYAFTSNIGYGLQYLEYLDHQIKTSKLHATVKSQSVKSFILTGMSIVEALAWGVLKKGNELKKVEWEEVAKTHGTGGLNGLMDGTELRIRSIVERKPSTPKDAEMSLHSMLQKIQKKKLFGIDSGIFVDLKNLRDLRNKIHIHGSKHATESDWNSFSETELQIMKNSLHAILSSPLFNQHEKNSRIIKFLEVET